MSGRSLNKSQEVQRPLLGIASIKKEKDDDMPRLENAAPLATSTPSTSRNRRLPLRMSLLSGNEQEDAVQVATGSGEDGVLSIMDRVRKGLAARVETGDVSVESPASTEKKSSRVLKPDKIRIAAEKSGVPAQPRLDDKTDEEFLEELHFQWEERNKRDWLENERAELSPGTLSAMNRSRSASRERSSISESSEMMITGSAALFPSDTSRKGRRGRSDATFSEEEDQDVEEEDEEEEEDEDEQEYEDEEFEDEDAEGDEEEEKRRNDKKMRKAFDNSLSQSTSSLHQSSQSMPTELFGSPKDRRSSEVHIVPRAASSASGMETLEEQMEGDEQEDGQEMGELSTVKKRKGRDNRKRRRDMEHRRERENEEMEEDEEELEAVNAAEDRVAAVRKVISDRSRAMQSDSYHAKSAQSKAVENTVRNVKKSRSSVIKVSVPLLDVEDAEEIDDDRVNIMVKEILAHKMQIETQTLLGWRSDVQNRYYIVDGRHRLVAYKIAIEKTLRKPRYTEAGVQITPMAYQINVEVMEGGRIAAMVKKMVMESGNEPTVFQKVIFVRRVMDGLGMLNAGLTVNKLMKMINEDVCGYKPRTRHGTPIYIVKAACFNDGEINFIMKNTRKPPDCSTLLKLYCTAREVNAENAYKHLVELDGEMDDDVAKVLFQELRSMKNSVYDLLRNQGYDENEARDVQSRLFKNAASFSALKRLMSGRNRLSQYQNEVDKVLVALERCMPPVTFTKAKLTRVKLISAAPSTLFIIDNEHSAVLDMPKDIAKLANAQQPRSVNFLIINGDCKTVEEKMRKAIQDQRALKRRSIQSLLVSSEIEVGTSEVSVVCAEYQRVHNGSSLPTNTVRAVLLRSADGHLLGQADLCSFMEKTKIQGHITRTCLRLLSYNPDLAAKVTEHNSVFVYSDQDVAPIAVAARCSANRITTLASLSRSLTELLSDMQESQDDHWGCYDVYQHALTADGKLRPVEGLRRKRSNKSKKQPRNGPRSGRRWSPAAAEGQISSSLWPVASTSSDLPQHQLINLKHSPAQGPSKNSSFPLY